MATEKRTEAEREARAQTEAQTIQARHSNPPDYPDGRKLRCGCTVYYRAHVMSASRGSSCPDCYDRMSD